jgi:hypothetical protein
MIHAIRVEKACQPDRTLHQPLGAFTNNQQNRIDPYLKGLGATARYSFRPRPLRAGIAQKSMPIEARVDA